MHKLVPALAALAMLAASGCTAAVVDASPATWSAWASGMVTNGLVLVWPAALLAAALVVCAGWRPWIGFVAWVSTIVALAFVQPSTDEQPRVLAAVQFLAIAGVAAVQVRHGRAMRRELEDAKAAIMAEQQQLAKQVDAFTRANTRASLLAEHAATTAARAMREPVVVAVERAADEGGKR